MIEDKPDVEIQFHSSPTRVGGQMQTTTLTTATTTNKEKKWKKSRVLKHHRNQWKILLRSTLPIFVAATISKAVSQFLEFIIGSGDIRDRIIVELFYTIFIAHVAGYLIAFFVPTSNVLFDYYLSLATDNASFAWSSTITLIILKYLYHDPATVWSALLVWILIIIVVCLIIYIVNYIQEVYFHLSTTERRVNIRSFESECFSLAIAYALTVIVAVAIYHNESTDYLSNTDDINPTNDDNSQKNDLNWLFFVYVVIISILMFSYQAWMNRRIKKKKMKMVAQVLIERTSFTGNPIQAKASGGAEKSNFMLPKLRKFQDEEPDCMDKIEVFMLNLYHRIMFWDDDKQAYIAFASFYYTTIAYTVSCGWYMWSILTVQKLFRFTGGDILGLALYAIVATLFVATILTILSVKEEFAGLAIDVETSEENENRNNSTVSENTKMQKAYDKLEKKSILYYAFSRLTIGLAWQQLFITIVAAIVPDGESDRSGYVALVKMIAAGLLFLFGCWFEKYLKTRKRRNSSSDSAISTEIPVNTDETTTFLSNIMDIDEEYEEPLL